MSMFSNLPLWYVIQTKPKQENRASYNLAAGDIETYFPKICKWNSKKVKEQSTYQFKPLFPSYIFAKFNALTMSRKVRYTRGVKNILSLDTKPCSVDDEIIEIIKNRCDEDGFVHVEKKFNPGDKVMITKPYLEDFSGIFEKELKDTERVSILLTAVNYQAHIIVEKQFVEKVENTY